MNLEEAKDIINKSGENSPIEKISNVDKNGKRWHTCNLAYGKVPGHERYYTFTDRELIQYAQTLYSKNYPSKFVKKLSHKKNRTATRDIIQTEDFDKLPQEGPVKTEDIWNWD